MYTLYIALVALITNDGYPATELFAGEVNLYSPVSTHMVKYSVRSTPVIFSTPCDIVVGGLSGLIVFILPRSSVQTKHLTSYTNMRLP